MNIPSRRDIATVDSNDSWTMLHATRAYYIGLMIHGFDATGSRSREFSTAVHKGLFVSHREDIINQFGTSKLAFRAKVKNLFPVDYNGNIGPSVVDRYTREDPADLYPESDRPHLSYMLLETPEPQALFIGQVKSQDIEGVQYQKQWYSRDQFLKEFEGRTFQGPGDEGSVTIGQPQMDRSRADHSIDELVDYMLDKSTTDMSRDRAKRYLETLVKGARRNSDPEQYLTDTLKRKTGLDENPARSLARKLLRSKQSNHNDLVIAAMRRYINEQ